MYAISYIKITHDQDGRYTASLHENRELLSIAVDQATADTPTQAVQALMEKGHLQ